MKQLFSVCLIILLLTVTASADVLWEPYDNAYYWDNYEKATTIAAKYEVPEGSTVNIYTAPVGGELIKTLEGGTVVYVGFSMEENGELWATGYPLYDYETEGWFRLGRLQKQYSHSEFINDYADQISAQERYLTASDIGGTIYTWTYPGSGISDGTLPEEILDADYNDGKISYGLVYTDPDGGQWGYIGYHMGHVGWMYLDNPTDPEPALRLYPEVESTVTDISPEENCSPPPTYGKVLALVGIVIVVTAIGIVTLKKKK